MSQYFAAALFAAKVVSRILYEFSRFIRIFGRKFLAHTFFKNMPQIFLTEFKSALFEADG